MTPRLLLNENYPLPSVKLLRGAGWEVLAIAESHASIDDVAVMRLARESSRWLITFDLDYGELVFRQHLPPPLVLLLRVPSYLPEDPAAWIDRLYRGNNLQGGHSASTMAKLYAAGRSRCGHRSVPIEVRYIRARMSLLRLTDAGDSLQLFHVYVRWILAQQSGE